MGGVGGEEGGGGKKVKKKGLKNHKKSACGFFFRLFPPPWSLVLGYPDESLGSSVDFTGSYLTYLTERLGEEGLREVYKH